MKKLFVVGLGPGNPSQMTAQARAALETVRVSLADHIIVADRDFVSFAESGYLAR